MAIDTSKILAATTGQPKSAQPSNGKSKDGDAKTEAGKKAATQEGTQQSTTVSSKATTDQATAGAAKAAITVPGTDLNSAHPSIKNGELDFQTIQSSMANSTEATSNRFGIPPTQNSGPEAWQQPGVNAFPPSGNVGPVAIAQAQVIQAAPQNSSPAPIQQTFVEAPPPAPEPPKNSGPLVGNNGDRD